jgi:ankyrin repeat protein
MIKAIEADNDDIMLKIFNHGAKAEVLLDKKKAMKPLHFIATNGSVRCLLILMGKGLEELSPQDHEGDTPLNMAIRNSQTVVAKSLIELGAELEVKDASMRTPLMNACLYGNLELVKVLLESGSDWKVTNAINDS